MMLTTALVSLCLISVVESLDFVHHDAGELEYYLRNINETYYDLTHLYSIGKSVTGVDLWVIAIGYQPNEHIALRPHVKYIGNMHGNEASSREVLLHLIDHMVTRYGTDQEVTSFLNTTVLHILPSMNPDGYSQSYPGQCYLPIGRWNARNVDLNRDFPDVMFSDVMPKTPEPETQAVIDWMTQHNFVLSLSVHSGEKVVNYPYDQYINVTRTSGISHTPDHDTFRHVALVYSTSHNDMSEVGKGCHSEFTDGIINGAEWYPISGGMQDYNYIAHGVFEVLVEIDCCIFPSATDLPKIWTDNKMSLLKFAAQVHRGVKGVISNGTEAMEGVRLSIEGRETAYFRSLKHGEYFRMLMPGNYTLQVHSTYSEDVVFNQSVEVTEDEVTILDIDLHGVQGIGEVLPMASDDNIVEDENKMLDFVHHNASMLEDYLRNVSETYPLLTHVYSIGQSIEGVNLTVIAIGYKPREHKALRPHVKYIGNIHGNEASSREVLLHLIDHMVTRYGTDQAVTSFLNTTVLHILPSINPDGYANAYEDNCHSVYGRWNMEFVDPNENFPDVIYGENSTHPTAPETQAVIDWMTQHNFVLSLSVHAGDKVASYPYDQYINGSSVSPDDDTFRHLALVYSTSHSDMFEGKGCYERFEDGVTYGADWYPIQGGMQDYNYIAHGVFEVLVDIDCCYFPSASYLPKVWTDNKMSLINFAAEVHRGVKGVISNGTEAMEGVRLSIEGRETARFRSLKHGEYFRILMPGNYTLQVHPTYSEDVAFNQSFQVSEEEVTILYIDLYGVQGMLETTEESVTQESVTNDDVTHDGARQDNVTHDGVTRDDVTHDGVTLGDDVTHDGVTRDDVTHDGVTRDDITHDGVTPDDVTHDGVTREDVTHDGVTELGTTDQDVTQKCETQECVTQEYVTQENVTSENVTHEAVTDSFTNATEDATYGDVSDNVTVGAPVTDEHVTIPDVSEPGVTEPGVTAPGVTEPGVTEPGVSEPGVTEPGVTENVTQANITGTGVTMTASSGLPLLPFICYTIVMDPN